MTSFWSFNRDYLGLYLDYRRSDSICSNRIIFSRCWIYYQLTVYRGSESDDKGTGRIYY